MRKFSALSLVVIFLILTSGCFSAHKRGNSSIEEKPGQKPDPMEATEVTESLPPPVQFENASGSLKSLHVGILPETAELCEGECLDIVANTTGGNPPYTFTWSHDLAAVSGPHRVCPDVDTTYLVTVRDTGVDTIEFPIPSEVAHGSITITVREECATSDSQDAGIDSQVLDSGDDSETGSIADSGATDIAVVDEGTTVEQCTTNCPDLEWVEIPGGTFEMGGTYPDNIIEFPRHEVTVPGFKMLKTEVTVSQFAKCVHAGVCREPSIGTGWSGRGYAYTWGDPICENHPVNGVDWVQAREFAEWIGARLPTEAEWEYAARSGGQDIIFPWGDEEPTCEHAVILYFADMGCDDTATMEVCSKPLGNTDQGLCNMAGNVSEWVEDGWHYTYDGAPSNGRAWVENPLDGYRTIRGGEFDGLWGTCRAASRAGENPISQSSTIGFRVAKDL